MTEENSVPVLARSDSISIQNEDSRDFEKSDRKMEDLEKEEVVDHARQDKGPIGVRPEARVVRSLNQRHIQMLALAGAIGSGLFLSSGLSLERAGPVGMLLGYIAVSTIVIAVMLSLSEMAALSPTSGSYVRYASMWFDPALGASIGWNLSIGVAISVPAELTACYVIVSYWTGDSINAAVFISVFGILIFFSSIISVRAFGEVEFFFSMLKITLIVGLIIFGVCIDLGAGPKGDRIGFRYWRVPFQPYLVDGSLGNFLGFYSVLNTAVFSFSGSESVAMAAAETQSPRQNIPKAAKRVFIRIILFYLLSLFVVSLILDSNNAAGSDDGTAAASPFVLAASEAGIHSVASIINAVVLTSAWSSGNQAVLSGSRSLVGLALDGLAPKVFLKTHRFGVPYVAVGTICIFMCLAFLSLSSGGSTVFGWLQTLVSASVLMQWLSISFTYLRFFYGMKSQNVDRRELPYRSPFQPFLGWWSLCFCILLIFTGGFDLFIHPSENFSAQGFLSSYFFPIFNILCYFIFKLVRKTKIIPLSEIPIYPWLQDVKEFPEQPLSRPKGWKKLLYLLWA